MGIKITFHIAAMSVNESSDFDNTANQDNTNVSCNICRRTFNSN